MEEVQRRLDERGLPKKGLRGLFWRLLIERQVRNEMYRANRNKI
jgi:hypothetical protein